MSLYAITLSLGLAVVATATTTLTVPTTAPTSAATLDHAPVGLSFEFYMFPEYFTSVKATDQCLQNLENLTGTWPHIRIGGTTQDRATYDPSSPSQVSYTVSSPTDVPDTLTYGPSFMNLAGSYKGSVVMGLNRGHDNITNTIVAAKAAKSKLSNLLAIELGNEPDQYPRWGQKIVADHGGSWSPSIDAESQDDWGILVGSELEEKEIFQAGVWGVGPPTWGAVELIATENSTSQSYVKTYCHHLYPGGGVQSLMSHENVVTSLKPIRTDFEIAMALGKECVLGETNSVAGGGSAGVSPTFGAALWLVDYALHAATLNIRRSYFHQGTIGTCQYCWWGRFDMSSTYYGAYAATAAMAGGSYISSLDTGSTNYGGYVIYSSDKKPLRVILVNSDYYDGSGGRTSETFVLTGLLGSSVKAKRLTAPSAQSRQDQGSNPSFGGQVFENVTCLIAGKETYETYNVTHSNARFTVAASEVLVIYL